MNLSDGSDESKLYMEPLAFKIPKITIYMFILVLSTTGNLVVVTIIARSKRMKASPGNLLIANLAVCDLLTPICSIPFDLALEESSFRWPFGAAMCKLLFPAATFTCTSSSFTLAVISLDRYRTLMHPFKRRLNTRVVLMFIILIHVASAVLTVPHMVTLQLTPDSQCREVWPSEMYPKMYTMALFLGQYIIPLLIMAFMYILASRSLFGTTQRARSLSICSAMSETKPGDSNSTFGSIREFTARSPLERTFRKNSEQNARVTKMFVLIVIVFAVVTLPNELLWIWADFAGGKRHPHFHVVAIICRMFTYSNSCVNPLIFYKFSRDFHEGFLALLGLSSLDGEKRAQGVSGSGTLHRPNGRLSASFLTPRGSLQSTPRHSLSFADHVTEKRRISYTDPNLNVNLTEYSRHKTIDIPSGTLPGALPGSPLHKEWIEHHPNKQCKIKITIDVYECDFTIELSNLESLLYLPQTDC